MRKTRFTVARIILCISIVFFLFYYIEYDENFNTSIHTRTIEKDGFCVCQDSEYLETTDMPCPKLQTDVLSRLPPDYLFIDYKYKINNGALSTFHRDVTSSQYIHNTQYPVYTLILYKHGGELLSLCPRSDRSYPFVWSNILNVSGEPGTAFLFNCDILHAGCSNHCKKREVIQYKLCHKEDLPKLEHLLGVDNTKNDECSLSFYNKCMRKLSYYFEMPINTFFYPLLLKRNDENTLIGKIQSYIPVQYYNNY